MTIQYQKEGMREGARKEILKQRLVDAYKEVDSFVSIITDGEKNVLRKKIDPELRDLLATLLAFGLNTDQSCWGHPDDVNTDPLPYISFSGLFPDNREYTYQETEWAVKDVDDFEKKLKNWLNEFYQSRVVDSRTRIIVSREEGMPGLVLETSGRENFSDNSKKEQREIVEIARREWQDFANFLRKKYYQDFPL